MHRFSKRRPLTRLVIACAVAAACHCAPVAASPADVTPLEVEMYRQAVFAGCRAQGRQLQHTLEHVDRRCKCVERTLAAKLSEDEWKRATYFAQQGRGDEEARVLAPHMPALKKCAA